MSRSITVCVYAHARKEERNLRIEDAWKLYTGEEETAEQILVKDARGCPQVAAREECYVSITDSEDYWMIAFSKQRIGIDLQKQTAPTMPSQKDEEGRCRRLASRFYHPEEAAYVLEADEPGEVVRRFFELWTAKEARVKFLGTGIDNSFTEFNVLDPQLKEMMEWFSVLENYNFCVCREAAADVRFVFREIG